jgi:hypothetical protein
MTVPVNHVGMRNIQDEFGGSSSDGISISEYYRGGSYVPLNQLPSIHSTGSIPLLSGGVGQTISIGMFRGTAKFFQWTFNITQDRFNTFNLYNELRAVGWDGSIPIEVTINISTGVYIVPTNTSSYAIDASGPFSNTSRLTINNNGNIFGRGGKGGTGGIYPSTPGGNGENGGNALILGCRTFINNNGVIAGGGGGGAGGAGAISPRTLSAGGESYYTVWHLYNGPSGGGGAPFGAAGDYQGAFGMPTSADQAAVVNSDLSAPSYHNSSAANAAAVNERGMPGYETGTYTGTGFNYCHAGFGGKPGSAGQNSYNLGSGGWGPLYGIGGVGGEPGYAIIGGSHVEWTKFGTVRGKLDNFGTLLGANNSNLAGLYLPNPNQPFNGINGFNSIALNEVYRVMPRSVKQGSYEPNAGRLTNNWSNTFGDILYSYSPQSNWADISASSGPATDGSRLWFIKYTSVCQVPQDTIVKINGIVDDKITYIKVNGNTVLTFGNSGVGSYTQIFDTATFTVPSGNSVIEIGVRDDNGNSGTTYGNLHMIFLRVLTVPFNQILVNADQWYVKEITNL